MPYGHAESNDLLRNRERSMPYGHATRTEFGVLATRDATLRSSEYALRAR